MNGLSLCSNCSEAECFQGSRVGVGMNRSANRGALVTKYYLLVKCMYFVSHIDLCRAR